MSLALHMTETAGGHATGYTVSCRCGWTDGVTHETRGQARQAGDAHLADAHALCIACGGPIHNPTWGCTNPRTR